MSYQRTTWVNGQTPINADNLNNIENGIGLSYGLTGGIAIPKNSDLDNYKTVGNYYSAGSGVSGTLSNTPITGGAFMLKVLNGYGTTDTGSILVQKIIDSYDGTEHTRSYSGGTWKTWRASETRKLLWINASASSAFAGQTLSLDLSIFNYVEIVFNLTTGGSYRKTVKTPINLPCTVSEFGSVASSTEASCLYYRAVTTVSTSQITFSPAYKKKTNETSTAQDNSYLIPYKIYGIKGV